MGSPEDFEEIKKPLIREWDRTESFVECDLEYPDELHELHNYYPMAP